MPTFDIVSKFDPSEVDNAIQNLKREIVQRYDFKNSNSEIEFEKELIIIKTDDDYKLTQLQEMLKVQITKRGIDVRALDMGKVEMSAGQAVRQTITMMQGINKDISKDIIKIIKESKIKVQVSIQGDELRISGKKRDDLQQTITLLKTQSLDLPLQFINFRD
ncbi:MAG: YajQ family cyclic di-GMP-binding protein [Rhodobiaceae bacterium]|nr:YajQ family cyclic di-GMP-binding protein [Rhodobiaceae bacterium]RZO33580.1 MAG: YajQ family cyclic di-GMP-binding protein [Hyphomicrobiales bacterium]|tara:strand:- start:1532 stop:2017 length:486 start_codon:yes stop_codon:yes gene_type:complete